MKIPKIALVNLNSIPGLGLEEIFPVGLNRLDSFLQESGYQTRVIDFLAEPDEFQSLVFLSDDYDYIVVSLRNLDSMELNGRFLLPTYRRLLERIRARTKAPILLGGAGYTVYSAGLTDQLPLDVGIIGPGEDGLNQIISEKDTDLRHVIRSTDKSFSRRTVHCNKKLLAAYLKNGAKEIGIPTMRGKCHLKCKYCVYGLVQNEEMVKREIGILRAEILELYDLGVRNIFFTDPVFNLCAEHAKTVCQMLRELSLPNLGWVAYVLPIADCEFLELAAASGCKNLLASFDTFSPEMLLQLDKSFTIEQITEFIQMCNLYQLPLMSILLFGGPGENAQTVRETCAFANKYIARGQLFFSFGIRIQPESVLAKLTGIPEEELIYPYFWPMGEEIFESVFHELDKKFIHFKVMMRTTNWRLALREMQSIPTPSGQPSHVLLSKAPGGVEDEDYRRYFESLGHRMW